MYMLSIFELCIRIEIACNCGSRSQSLKYVLYIVYGTSHATSIWINHIFPERPLKMESKNVLISRIAPNLNGEIGPKERIANELGQFLYTSPSQTQQCRPKRLGESGSSVLLD